MYAFLFRSFAKKESRAMRQELETDEGSNEVFLVKDKNYITKRVLMNKIKQKESADVTGQRGGNYLVNGLLGSTECSWSFV